VDFVPKNTWMTRLKYNHSSIKKIICVSHKITTIIKAYVREPDKTMTIHSGIDLGKFNTPVRENILRKEFNIRPGSFIIGNTSALEHHKDYFTFLDTVSLLVRRKIPLKAFIIGAGSLENKLKDYTVEKQLTGAVHFTGFRKDISSVLTSLDLFLITSNEEGLGTSVLDAFAAGIPVVGTAAGGIPEMVINNQTGMLAAVGDNNSLANAVEQVLCNPALKERLISNAKEKVKEFSKEITARKTLHVYQEIISAPVQH
jgi:glycosyltransferase involved in cell wall biosynthesis